MSYQYLFCATCGQRRTGHGYRCTVCDSLLRHETPRLSSVTVHHFETVVRARPTEPRENRVPIAA